MSDTTVVVADETINVLVEEEVVNVTFNDETVVITVAEQGPRGAQGIPGIGISDAFTVANRFSELATQQMKVEARTNLELNHIDCGVFE